MTLPDDMPAELRPSAMLLLDVLNRASADDAVSESHAILEGMLQACANYVPLELLQSLADQIEDYFQAAVCAGYDFGKRDARIDAKLAAIDPKILH